MAWEENSCISLNMQLIAILSRIGVYCSVPCWLLVLRLMQKTIRQRLRLCCHIMILKETPLLIPPIRIPSSRTRPCKR